MNNKNTYYYEWNKEKLKKYACNCYDLKNGKAKSKEYYEITKKLYKNKHEMVTEIFSEKKRQKTEHGRNRSKNMPKEDTEKLKEHGNRYCDARKLLY